MAHVDGIVPGVGAGKRRRDAAPGGARARGQDAYILAYVLVVVLLTSLMGYAVLRLMAATMRVTGSAAVSSAALRVADSALEEAANTVRFDDDLVGPTKDCDSLDPDTDGVGTTPYSIPDYQVPGSTDVIQVACTAPGVFGTIRVMDLQAVRHPQVGADVVVGQARIRVDDDANGVAITGYTIEICDWQLGSEVEPLKGCT